MKIRTIIKFFKENQLIMIVGKQIEYEGLTKNLKDEKLLNKQTNLITPSKLIMNGEQPVICLWLKEEEYEQK